MNSSTVNFKRKREPQIVDKYEDFRKRMRTVEPSITRGFVRAKTVDSNKENTFVPKTVNHRIVNSQRSADYSQEDTVINIPTHKKFTMSYEERIVDEDAGSFEESLSQSESLESSELKDGVIEQFELNGESSDSDIERLKKEKYYKTRLFLGEANFSFTQAFLEKHEQKYPGLAQCIIPTAYENNHTLIRLYGDTFLDNAAAIKSKGVTIKYNVDATRLRSCRFLKDRHVKRIHFNFPHDGSPISHGTLPQMLKEFFQEAAEIQEPWDRVHIALPAPKDIEQRKFREGRIYCIYEATRSAGYNLIKKRKFGSERYPGYQHVQTRANSSASITERAREYIFEKLPDNASNKDFRAPTFDRAYDGDRLICLPEMETDSESSSYEDSESV